MYCAKIVWQYILSDVYFVKCAIIDFYKIVYLRIISLVKEKEIKNVII